MKIVATSVYSKTSQNVVTDEFSLTLSDLCGANKIALDLVTFANNNAGAAVSSFTYTINSAPVSKKPAISTIKTNLECPIASKLYIFQTADSTWLEQTVPSAPYTDWIKSFDPATGELQVEKLGAYTGLENYKVKITFTDPLALDPAAITVQSFFDVTIIHTCTSNNFALTPQLDYTYTVPAGTVDANSPTVPIAKTTVTGANPACELSYRTDIWDNASQTWIELTAAYVSSNLNSFVEVGSYSDTKTDGVHFDSNLYNLLLPFSKLDTFVATFGSSVKMRSRVTDVAGKSLTDEYILTFVYACWSDKVTQDATDISD